MEKKVFDLILKCLRDEATQEEQKFVFDWIALSQKNKKAYEDIRDASFSEKLNQTVSTTVQERIWKNISAKIDKDDRNSSETRYANLRKDPMSFTLTFRSLAAAVVLAFLLGAVGVALLNYYQNSKIIQQYYTIEAPLGAQSRVTMADGSQIFLNAGSIIRYPKNFNEGNRDIFLEGEGYFKIAKNENLKFRVFASEIIVEALGTEFNVKAYPDEDRIETTLVEGSVSIRRNKSGQNSDQQIILQPNEKVYFLASSGNFEDQAENIRKEEKIQKVFSKNKPLRMIIDKDVNTVLSTSWTEKKWVLERESLESLAEKIERQFDVQIFIEDQELRQYNISGTLKDESLEQILSALQLTIPLNYRISEKKVFLTLDKVKVNKYESLLKNKNITIE